MRATLAVLSLTLVLSAVACGAAPGIPTPPTPAGASALPAAPPIVPLVRTSPPGHRSWTPWPQALHDARRSAASTAVGPQTSAVRWRRHLEGSVTPGPVVAHDGTIYAASNGGVLHALDPATGRDRWTFDGHGTYGSDLSTSPAVLPDGTVVWPGPNSTLFALDPAGHLLWTQQLGGPPTSPAVSAEGLVVVGDTSGGVTALSVSAGTHRVLWRAQLDSLDVATGRLAGRSRGGPPRSTTPPYAEVWTAPAVDARHDIYWGTHDGHVYGADPAGRRLLDLAVGASVESYPALSGDGLLVLGVSSGDLLGIGGPPAPPS